MVYIQNHMLVYPDYIVNLIIFLFSKLLDIPEHTAPEC